ncbi:urea ABC transporter ATP-binding protein UrtD [Priestia flexa]|uniref:Urea ABC transporter ATP-binding protein UrtD n=2 Tax=Priestia TaxID=2800373 RepID=A0A0V8JQF3_9BACI|nr:MULTISPECIES: urea ABC transporter ATP-binding protein UrtD [Bacillaceae]AQX54565.1 urea ABC transporter ATP-binding protein UrtD [Priestia flexa]KSU89279.1 urea ABC transporter ATP-binding protein UrtD [Priestia veravalensis]KZB93423.1 ABC transporter ATP-binding protein [Bacillus sp. VT 712]MBY6085642.1 urea ABC transporter ATP-binding protein UrtD [Priestia flexa]MCA1201781.1 urea ABC transporter ATP-binding protein UrtD [Priestia flexa]
MSQILWCDNVMVDFDGFKALQGVDLMIEPNEVRFLIGPNGAGKTTILDVICGKTKATSGRVLFEEVVNLGSLQEHKIVQKGIARKFQNPSIFSQLSVFENLELSIRQKRNLTSVLFARMTGETKNHIEKVLEQIGLQDFVYKQAGELSHGQKQWLEIGMQLMQNPSLLLLDEPIAGMTGKEREKTGELMHEISASCSVLVVEHDMDFVRKYSKQVTVMHEGKILCEGNMTDVQENEHVQEVYLGRRKQTC